MRIGFDAQFLTPEDTGVGRCTCQLLAALAQADAGDEFFAYVPFEKGGPLDFVRSCNIKLRRTTISARYRLCRILTQQTVLPIRMRIDRLDVFHATAYTMPLAASVPTVLTLHDVIALKAPSLCRTSNVLHYKLMVPLSIRSAAHIIASSQHTRNEICKRFEIDADRISVVHPGIAEHFMPVVDRGKLDAVRRRYGLADFLLFVGRLEPKKNLGTLIRAFHLLVLERPLLPHDLVLVGPEGWGSNTVFKLIDDLALAHRVSFLGYVPDEDLPAIYSLARALVFPSECEGFGIPPVEAMACGTPVISSSTTSLPETTGGAAMYVDPADEVALAQAMAKVLDDSGLRRSLVKAGFKNATRFSWRRAALDTLNVYRKVVDGSA